jgi:hypothetical protein
VQSGVKLTHIWNAVEFPQIVVITGYREQKRPHHLMKPLACGEIVG